MLSAIARKSLLLLLSLSLLASDSLGQTKRSTKPKTNELIAVVEPEFFENNWKKFSSTEGRFSVVMPGKPVPAEQQLVLSDGIGVLLHSNTVTTRAEYGVSYADYPTAIEGTDGLVTFLSGVRDAGVKGINGRLVEDKEISVEGHPGRFYRVEYGSDYFLNSKTFVVGSRLYLVMATTSGKKADVDQNFEAYAKKFFDSFKLTPKR